MRTYVLFIIITYFFLFVNHFLRDYLQEPAHETKDGYAIINIRYRIFIIAYPSFSVNVRNVMQMLPKRSKHNISDSESPYSLSPNLYDRDAPTSSAVRNIPLTSKQT